MPATEGTGLVAPLGGPARFRAAGRGDDPVQGLPQRGSRARWALNDELRPRGWS